MKELRLSIFLGLNLFFYFFIVPLLIKSKQTVDPGFGFFL